MSTTELQQGTEMAWKYAYSWRGIARRLKASPASLPLALLTNLGYRYYAHRLHKFYTCDWILRSHKPPLNRSQAESLMIRSSQRPRFRLTIVHPCVGRREGMKRYIRTWQMEPIPPAIIAALAPPDIEIRFYDDRLETLPFDEPTDLVAISVETYTAKRCYQIASEYRRRKIPVVMGGFHATLCPAEVIQFCESIVIGEAEELFPK